MKQLNLLMTFTAALFLSQNGFTKKSKEDVEKRVINCNPSKQGTSLCGAYKKTFLNLMQEEDHLCHFTKNKNLKKQIKFFAKYLTDSGSLDEDITFNRLQLTTKTLNNCYQSAKDSKGLLNANFDFKKTHHIPYNFKTTKRLHNDFMIFKTYLDFMLAKGISFPKNQEEFNQLIDNKELFSFFSAENVTFRTQIPAALNEYKRFKIIYDQLKEGIKKPTDKLISRAAKEKLKAIEKLNEPFQDMKELKLIQLAKVKNFQLIQKECARPYKAVELPSRCQGTHIPYDDDEVLSILEDTGRVISQVNKDSFEEFMGSSYEKNTHLVKNKFCNTRYMNPNYACFCHGATKDSDNFKIPLVSKEDRVAPLSTKEKVGMVISQGLPGLMNSVLYRFSARRQSDQYFANAWYATPYHVNYDLWDTNFSPTATIERMRSTNWWENNFWYNDPNSPMFPSVNFLDAQQDATFQLNNPNPLYFPTTDNTNYLPPLVTFKKTSKLPLIVGIQNTRNTCDISKKQTLSLFSIKQ